MALHNDYKNTRRQKRFTICAQRPAARQSRRPSVTASQFMGLDHLDLVEWVGDTRGELGVIIVIRTVSQDTRTSWWALSDGPCSYWRYLTILPDKTL